MSSTPSTIVTPAGALFSASQIARALGWRRQRIQRSLAGVSPDGTLVIGGNPAAGFSLGRLPRVLVDMLQTEATRNGYDSIERMIGCPPLRWAPAVPLIRQSPAAIDRAQKLRAALSPALERSSDPAARDTHLAKEFLGHFREAVGYPISERQWLRLFHRTLERDGGAEDWGRVEIYLDDRPVAATERSTRDYRFDWLDLALNAATNLSLT